MLFHSMKYGHLYCISVSNIVDHKLPMCKAFFVGLEGNGRNLSEVTEPTSFFPFLTLGLLRSQRVSFCWIFFKIT